MNREPKFKVGDVLRVVNVEKFLVNFAEKIRDRDAVLKENIIDPQRFDMEPGFRGRVCVEFQKRNGRGKVFTKFMREDDFQLKTSKES